MKNELKNKSKITRATVKSFIRKNKNELFTKCKSSFDGMTDMVEPNHNASFKRVETEIDFSNEYNFGIDQIWLVGSSRDSFAYFEDDQFFGIEIYNSCGSSFVTVKKDGSVDPMTPKKKTLPTALPVVDASLPSNVIPFPLAS